MSDRDFYHSRLTIQNLYSSTTAYFLSVNTCYNEVRQICGLRQGFRSFIVLMIIFSVASQEASHKEDGWT